MLSKHYNRLMMLGLLMGLYACTPMGGGVKTQTPGKVQKVEVEAQVQTLYQQGVALMKAQRFKEAIPVFESMLTRETRVSGPYVNLGIAYMHEGDLEKAQDMLNKALQIDSAHVIAYNTLGIVYRKLARFAEAREMYEHALELDPDYSYAHANLGMLCDVYLQDLTCALQHYERYRELEPGDEEQANRWVADVQQRLDAPPDSSGG